MKWLKKKVDKESKESFVRRIDKEGRKLTKNKLIEVIRVEEMKLTELQQKASNTFTSLIISFSLSLCSLIVSLIVYLTNITNSAVTITSFENNYKYKEVPVDILNSQVMGIKSLMNNNLNVTSIFLKGFIFLLVGISFALITEIFNKYKAPENISKTKSKIKIFNDIVDNKQYKSDNKSDKKS